jgi:hypothetical protein
VAVRVALEGEMDFFTMSSRLDAHGPFLSDADEAEIVRRIAGPYDVADLALRTCTCGRRLEGFDDSFDHLRTVVRDAGPYGRPS